MFRRRKDPPSKRGSSNQQSNAELNGDDAVDDRRPSRSARKAAPTATPNSLYPSLEAFPTPEPLSSSLWEKSNKKKNQSDLLADDDDEDEKEEVAFRPIPKDRMHGLKDPSGESVRPSTGAAEAATSGGGRDPTGHNVKYPSSGTPLRSAASGGSSLKPPPPTTPSMASANFSSKPAAPPVTSATAPPLFGTRSKKGSLEDDLPDAAKQQEQHSAFEARRLQVQEETAIVSSSIWDDDDDDEKTGEDLENFSSTTTASSIFTRPSSSESRAGAASSKKPPASSFPVHSSTRRTTSNRFSLSNQSARGQGNGDHRKPPPGASVEASATASSVPVSAMSVPAVSIMLDEHDNKLASDAATAAAISVSSSASSRNSSMKKQLSPTEMEDAADEARQLRYMCEQDDIDLGSLEFLLTLCQDRQTQVKSVIEHVVASGASDNMDDLFQLNEVLMLSIKMATDARDSNRKQPASMSVPHSEPTQSPEAMLSSSFATSASLGGGPSSSPAASRRKSKADSIESLGVVAPTAAARSATTAANLEIPFLVERKDVFSLICMLRAQQRDLRLDAALALMKFARDAEQPDCSQEALRLRNEMRSSGGMHSLLTLFRTRGTPYETKVVVSLAVAYLLPSFVDAMTAPTAPSLGLKIMDCLRVLSSARKITPNGEVVSQEESFKASAKGLFIFWINQLLPILNTESGGENVLHSDLSVDVAAVPLIPSSSVGERIRHGRVTSGGGVFDQRRENIELQELLEVTVSLIIFIAREVPEGMKGDFALDASRYTLVEQVCAVEVARPIAVREGILKILVCWIDSMDPERVRPAASALRHLTSIQDKYMAGWIHSQMVNEGALQGIVKLTSDLDNGIGRDVHLSVAHILSSLCVAPHTRAAVVDADGIALLIQFLCEHKEAPSPEGALFAGRALLQLAAGAITRASVFGHEEIELGLAPIDKGDTVIENIIESGAIESFVEIALSNDGKSRTVAVEAMRVLSEDVSPSRQTRGHLCYHGAVKALGVALKENVEANGDLLQGSSEGGNGGREAIRELHEALCALANILDPLPEVSSVIPQYSRRGSNAKDTRRLLISGCMQTTDSGGLESLLFIAAMPFASPSNTMIGQMQRMSLLEEACRSLASISPLLLTETVASAGYSKWADDVLKALYTVSKRVEEIDGSDEIKNSATQVLVNVLQGLGALARSEPLKIRIMDRFLAYLLEANAVRDGTDTSDAANQVFQSLGFTDDDLAVQSTGNNPQLLADWFCLERSGLVQAMARDEVRRVVEDMWGVAFGETKDSFRADSHDSTITRLIRAASDFSSRSEESSTRSMDLFDRFAVDAETAQKRSSMLQQYRSIYGDENVKASPLLTQVSGGFDSDSEHRSLLEQQNYPLNSFETETQWVLSHDRFMKHDMEGAGDLSRTMLSPHVDHLLTCVFPSPLLRDVVLPIYGLHPEASFNFRGLLMPQKRYFSFRRDGQLLSRLCATESAALDTKSVHWTIGFRNSTFAGEFSESLVQALYLCPMIHGLSFSKAAGDTLASARDSGRESKTDEGAAILANLAGSLPPWITSLTFDGILNDRDLRSMVTILDTMGKLNAGHDIQVIQPQIRQMSRTKGDHHSNLTSSQAQGRFSFFSVRRSSQIREDSWKSFFRLLGGGGPAEGAFNQTPLSSLKALDLSGNQLGDGLCASILHLVHDKDSGCCLEQLDLSANRILAGTAVLNELRGYVETHRYSQQAGRKMKKGWTSPLKSLYLARNGLHIGKAWLEIVTLLKRNALELEALDLSGNDLTLAADELELGDVVVSSLLKNTSLQRLNLSDNKFSTAAITHILGALSAATNESELAFLQLDGNSPPLSDHQRSNLVSFSVRSRAALLQRFLEERDQQSAVEESGDWPESKHESVQDCDGLSSVHSGGLNTAEQTSSEAVAAKDDGAEGGDNMITVLFSEPLVFYDEHRDLRPFKKLDFRMERELMWQCLKEASRDIELAFDNATSDRLLAAVSKRCGCLHYSGHGHEEYLPFENKGGPQWFGINEIRNLIANEGGACFRFVFVSACHSYNVGMTFASAGVPHVVCCKQESELKDAAALSFTRNFYLALAVGNTVRESFDQGRRAVRATANLRNAEREMQKFRLLPEDGNHDITIFNAKPVEEWPSILPLKPAAKPRRGSLRPKKGLSSAGTATSELSVRNMMQEDPCPSPPQFFLGREVDMYYVLRQILETRLVSVVGEAGIGRSSMVCALCHYINERASTILEVERIYFVKAKQDRRKNRCLALLRRLVQKLKEYDAFHDNFGADDDIEDLSDAICRAIKKEKALIVFDRVDLLDDSDETNEFPMVLRKLIHETRNVRVLLTNRRPLGIPSIGEKSIELGPLAFANTVRLFANLCPYVHTPKDRRKLFEALVTDCEQEHLLPTDPGLTEKTTKIFFILGSGVPSRVEKAAYNITKNDYLGLINGSILDSVVVPTEVKEM